MRFSGIVKRHLGRGTFLGFPTANMDPPQDLSDGIYVGWAIVEPKEGEGKKLPAAIFIGSNPTFNESYKRAEIYILDFNQNLYDKELEVETLKRIRDVTRFDSAGALIEQMKHDVEVVREFFKHYNTTHEQ